MSLPSFRTALASSAVALASLALTACGNVNSADLPSEANPLDSEESAVVFELNSLRKQMNLPPVTNCYSLNVSASTHSDDLRDNPSLTLGITGSDGSDVKSRACTAGYTVACSGSPAMGEVVAFGYGTGTETVDGWASDPTSGAIVKNPTLIVVGVGRSQGAMGWYWTMDLGASNDPSCTGP